MLSLSVYLFFILALSSCSIQESSPISIKKQATKDSIKGETKPALKSNEELTFAIIYPVAHPFFEGVTISAKETAEKMGIEVIIHAPDASNVDQQIQLLEKMIKKKVDGIAIGPTDPAALTPFINKAADAGINIICFDTDAPESKRLSFIGTDNLAAGKHLGEVVARLLNYEGNIIVSTGISTMLNLNARVDGFKQTVKQHPKMKILDIQSSDGIPAKTLLNIEEMVEEHPDFDALVGVDSLSGPAAITAWKARGLNKKMVTFDDLPIILKGISNKQVTSTISQSQFKWGELIIKQLFDAKNGHDISSPIYTETVEVNLKTLDKYVNTIHYDY